MTMIQTPDGLASNPDRAEAGRSIHTSDRARARVVKRRAADTRLCFYGMIAIAFAGFALVALLYNVFVRATKVTTEHYIEVQVDIAEGENDFLSLMKSTMRDAFPEVSGRREKRQLYDIVSDGAADDMRNAAAAGELDYGEGITRQFLVSDTVDLYLRGEFGGLVEKDHRGSLSVVDQGKSVELRSTADDFAPALGFVKEVLRDNAARLKREAARQDAGVKTLTARAPDFTGQERADTLAQIEQFKAKRDRINAEAERLDGIITSSGGDALALTNRMPSFFVRANGGLLKLTHVGDTSARAKPILPLRSTDEAARADWSFFMIETPEAGRTVSDLQIGLVEQLRDQGRISEVSNWRFFELGDSTQPEIAGIKGALIGSLWTMLVTFSLAFPIGVMAAIYLEEFARKNRVTQFIEVNINNLAAVPSIVFGLLGLAVFLNFFGVPRSSPLAGGLVLALMTLPTVIIASRASIRAVPPSIRTAALGLGASKVQTTFQHVLPLAMPGILTGTIIGMAQALGETAPLLMIGMVAFITAVPDGITDSATVLPVQVFQWANGSERAFDARTAAAIIVLLGFLVLMNALAILLRKRFERRW